MKLQLLIAFCSATCGHSAYHYRIDDTLDEALEEFRSSVALTGEDFLNIGTIGAGGYVMYGVELRSISTLKRAGEAWLVPHYEEAKVLANLTLQGMELLGTKMEGPWRSALQPRIRVRDNEVAIEVLAIPRSTWMRGERMDERPCHSQFRASISRMSSVVLLADGLETRLDEWVRGFMEEITEVLNPHVMEIFGKHFDLCQWLRTKGYKLKNNGDRY